MAQEAQEDAEKAWGRLRNVVGNGGGGRGGGGAWLLAPLRARWESR